MSQQSMSGPSAWEPQAEGPYGPDGIERAVAVAGPVALRRDVSCALDNAVRAAGPCGHVLIEVAGSATEVTIQIVDDGPGPDLAPTNSSLGLTVTRALVSACGGSFSLKPRPAGGAVGVITLTATSRAMAS